MSSQAKTENYGLCQYGDNDIPDWRTDYTGDMAVIDEQLKARADGENLINKEVTELKQELDKVKKRGSDVKERLAVVITDKGVETASSADFDTIINNVKQIQTGVNNTQVLEDVLVSSVAITKVTVEDVEDTEE